jgi:hydrogenase maturation protein HypF
LLRQGFILAIKGLGGFHLACDATNAAAVQTLRERKRRPHKPFALMMATLDQVKEHCAVSPEEEVLLVSPQCPIVLMPWRETSNVVPGVAPRNRYLGVMLPYTPLHHVLLRDVGRPLVMTSGNLTEEPIAAENEEALRRLAHLADAFVLHNRDIYARYDDSVWFVPRIPDVDPELEAHSLGTALPQPIRRARGYAPFPIKLPFKARQILACGPEIKNTFCLTRDDYAFVSQHIGDMENLETLEHYRRTIELYKHLFRIEPEVIAYDLHPDYMTSKYARNQYATRNTQHVPIQHHHAHLAGCLADNGWHPDDGPVIGISLDGTGYGADGHIWGGEWLVGDYQTYRRAAHLEYLPLPGGDAATRNPWRIAFSYLYTLLGEESLLVVPQDVGKDEVHLLGQQIDRKLNCPLTSSMGRLFDAVSALLGVRTRTSYEAQAAIELEMAATKRVENWNVGRGSAGRWDAGNWGWVNSAIPKAYPFRVRGEGDAYVVELEDLFIALVDGTKAGAPVGEMAIRFHQTVARMTVEVCERIAGDTGLRTVTLSGGCFQNRLLLALLVPALKRAGFQVLLHRQVPTNDGGLSLGQAAIAQLAT